MLPMGRTLADGVVAGMVGALVSGAPSTLHTLATGGDLLEGARAAGSLLLPRASRDLLLLMAAVPVHLGLSLGWGVVLAAGLPADRPIVSGCLAGLGIAVLDLGLIGRRLDRIRALAPAPQVADHLAYGMSVAVVLRRRRRTRLS